MMGSKISYDEIMRQVDLRRRELINDAAVTLEQANERIRQLERLNKQLAAEIDKQRPIVDAAFNWYNGAANWSEVLAAACAAYEAAKEGWGMSTLSEVEKQQLTREAAADKWIRDSDPCPPREAFLAGWDAARLTEDYYTLAEVRLRADLTITEYGSYAARLHGIADLIDKKRPELKPTTLNGDANG